MGEGLHALLYQSAEQVRGTPFKIMQIGRNRSGSGGARNRPNCAEGGA